MTPNEQQLAERLREALISAALAAHEDAGIRGLCCQGQWEAAVNALRAVDLAPLFSQRERSAMP